jgi:histidinol-phosphate aminotransferase
MDTLEKLIRRHLIALKPYDSIDPVEVLAERAGIPPEQVIKLDANENPYGCSPRVRHALGEANSYHIYPDPLSRELRRLLGEYTGLDPEYIAVGNGSDELIDLILRLTLEPGDRVINCSPTFGMYPFSTAVCGGEIVDVPRGPDYSIDVLAIKSAVDRRTRVVFIASPNNPTGNLTSEGDILQLLETGVLVVVDEAYYEFAGVSVAHLVPSHANLIVLRTFSKWAGLAGLRVGYGILSPQMNEVIHRMKLPCNVTIAAQIAARESLADMDYLQGRIKAILTERERLFQGLKVQGILDPIPSKGNFLLCRAVNGEALEIKQGMERRGIPIRYYDVPRLRDKLRISVGKPEHTDALLRALSGC